MALVGSIVVGVALLAGALNGFRRGGLKEGTALVGVLLGVLLALLLGSRWGQTIATRTGWQPGTGTWLATMALLWITALLAGYASGVLLPRRSIRLNAALRGLGAFLGLLNGLLLTGFTFRFTQMYYYGETAQARSPSWIRAAVASNLLVDQLDLILLGLAWTLAVISLIITLVNLIRKLLAPRAAPAPGPAPAKPVVSPGVQIGASPPPGPTPPGMERSLLDKPRSPGSPG